MMLVGLGITVSLVTVLVNGFDQIKIDPQLIINFVIPPLIFEAMMRIDYKDFTRVKVSVLLLSTIGVAITTIAVGLVLMYIVNLPFQLAFLFAALISPTDAAIVIKTFKILKVPTLLSTIVEMESSFNDATGIIIFTTVAGIIFGSSSTIAGLNFGDWNGIGNGVAADLSSYINFELLSEIIQFLIVSLGGVVVGLVIAIITNRLHTLMNNPFT